MTSYEHRAIGDEASGGALVNLGGESGDDRRWAAEKPVASLRRH